MKQFLVFALLSLAVAASAHRGDRGGLGGPPKFHILPPPPVVEALPTEVQTQLRSIADDHSLKPEEKRKMVEEVLDKVSPADLSKIPPPPGFDKLPEDVQAKLKAIHSDNTLNWSARRTQSRAIIDALPEEQRKLLRGGRGHHGRHGRRSMPPHDFKDVLPESAWNELVEAHKDKSLNREQFSKRISEIMSKVPLETRLKLPLPPHLRSLPENIQKQLHEIFADTSLSFDQKREKERQLIDTLPESQRPKHGFRGRGPRPNSSSEEEKDEN